MTFVYAGDLNYYWAVKTYDRFMAYMDFEVEYYEDEEGKVCRNCAEWKQYDAFFKKGEGYTSRCIDCMESLSLDEGRGYTRWITRYGRECTLCGDFKYWDRFSTSMQNINHKTTKCKSCRSLEATLRKRNISFEDYVGLLVSQDFTCAICKQPESGLHPTLNRTKGLSIDHDHKSGNARGLLCSACNSAIGNFRENVEYLECAVEYVKKDKGSIKIPVLQSVRSSRDYMLRVKYGINQAQFNWVLQQQGNRCAICGIASHGKDNLYVDHIHGVDDSDSVRGILCIRCNYGIGYFLDDPWIIRNAIDYLCKYTLDIAQVDVVKLC